MNQLELIAHKHTGTHTCKSMHMYIKIMKKTTSILVLVFFFFSNISRLTQKPSPCFDFAAVGTQTRRSGGQERAGEGAEITQKSKCIISSPRNLLARIMADGGGEALSGSWRK